MEKSKDLIYQLDGKPPLTTAIPLGLQHVLAMFVGNITPIIIISGVLNLSVAEKSFLIQCAMFVAGIVSLVQCYPIGPVGARLPIIMGTSFGFLPVCIAIGMKYGLPGVLGAVFAGGIFQLFIGLGIKYIRKYFPPLVTGIVLLAIGLSLIGTGMKYFAGGVGAEDFGSVQNLMLGTVVLATLLFFKQFTKGMTSMSAVLIALIVGYIVAIPMGKINFEAVANAHWFAVPVPLKFGMEFYLDAMLSMFVMNVISTVETVGNTCGIVSGGIGGRCATDREVSGAVIADGLGTSFAALFNVLPNTSYGQNVGIITMTGVINRFAVAMGAMFLLLAGFFPKLGAIVAVMPPSVLGGAAVVMFSMMVVSGINQVTEEPLRGKNGTILAVSLGLGLGFSLVPEASKHFPHMLKMLFEGSGVAVATFVAILLNIILPDDADTLLKKKHEAEKECKDNICQS
ncbi:putative purine permease Cpx [Peptoclostridium acidaminophilum DSM 3953]|uniref:Putative purine permease Cpx n=1 Tax=Peptoclostridium acidaminophilum DSM 3953 TaxID=1286171 RepID=W8T521_PEPAC|nr:nucleobase:cation symporter-2 family protein [Peptoclostridium acidaminophilum]AHM56864.1 putative purine permease Cpx [Peptoclostridium acidaminophilum DSM 3953]